MRKIAKGKRLHEDWKHLQDALNTNGCIGGFFTKEAAVGEETWVVFQKDYTDADGKEFKKDALIGLDAEDAKYLIKKGIVKEGKKPDDETLLKGVTDQLTETVVSQVTKSMKDIIGNANDRISKTAFNPAIPKNHEACYGFDDKGDFLKAVMDGCRPNGRLHEKFFKGEGEKFGSYENFIKGTPTGQNSIVDDEGNILIPDVLAEGIWEQAFPETEIMSQTDQRQTSGNSLKINTVPQTSRKDGYRFAGALSYWLAEADEYTASMIKWGQERLELHKLGALMYCTQEELDDASIALAPVFDKRMGQAIRWNVNKSFFLGTGSGQPQGIMRSNALVTVTPQAAEMAADGTIGHRDINAMYYRLLPNLRPGAQWLVHPNLEEQLEYISFNDDTTNKRPIYMPPNGLAQSPYGTLKGLPVRPFEFCNDLGQKGDIVLVNWSYYVTLVKAGKKRIQSASSIHLRFLFDETAFKSTFRVDGQSMLPAPIEDFNGTTKRGPWVTLGTRRSEGTSSGL